MNYFGSELRPLLHRARWRRIDRVTGPQLEGNFHIKSVCHVTEGVAVIATNLSSSSWVGSLTLEQLMRTVTMRASAIQAAPLELLKLLDNALRSGDIELRFPDSTTLPGSLLLSWVVEIVANQSISVTIPMDLFHVSTTGCSATDFLKEVVIQPSMMLNTAFVTVVELLLAQHRIGSEELLAVIQGASSTGWSVDGSNRMLDDTSRVGPWFDTLRIRCFPSAAPERASVACTSASPNASAASPLTRRHSEYVESPEEAARKRRRLEEQRTQAPSSHNTDPKQDKMKKVRRLLA